MRSSKEREGCGREHCVHMLARSGPRHSRRHPPSGRWACVSFSLLHAKQHSTAHHQCAPTCTSWHSVAQGSMSGPLQALPFCRSTDTTSAASHAAACCKAGGQHSAACVQRLRPAEMGQPGAQQLIGAWGSMRCVFGWPVAADCWQEWKAHEEPHAHGRPVAC